MHLLKTPYVILDCFACEIQIFGFLKKGKPCSLRRLTFTGARQNSWRQVH
jgi:hypothetical protein